MLLQGFVVGQLQANCYAVGDEESREVLLIDPGDQGPALLAELEKRDLRVVAVLATHFHVDHSGAVHELLEGSPGAQFLMHAEDYPRIAVNAANVSEWYGHPVTVPREPDRYLEHGDTIEIGSVTLSALHTPGHTPGSICVSAPGAVFTGDVLFQGSVGRTDFEGGSHEQLIGAIREHLFALPEETVVYPGHGPATTVGEEKRTNPFAGLGRGSPR